MPTGNADICWEPIGGPPSPVLLAIGRLAAARWKKTSRCYFGRGGCEASKLGGILELACDGMEYIDLLSLLAMLVDWWMCASGSFRYLVDRCRSIFWTASPCV